MAQIQAGITYADGAQVNATNLNAHVNNAVLVPGVISTQAAATSCTAGDSLLILQSGALKQATLAQVQAAIPPDLTSYVNKNGSVAMTGELTLSSSLPTAALSAASKGYVDTKQTALGFTPVNKAGDTGVGPIALSVDPVSALQVTTKQYVDAAAALKASLAGATFTGPVVLAADPASALQAATKQYVDTGLTGKISTGGATVAGTYLFSGKLQTSTAPTVANDVVNKAYSDSLIAAIPKFAGSAYFYTAAVGSAVVNEAGFLTVLATRTAGSSTLTVNYAGLNSRYYDPAKPFFLQNQYVGLGGPGGRLYKITSSDVVNRTFTIITTETTAFSGSITLSLVYDSTNLASNQYGQNIKSIYIDMVCFKMYVNYITDIASGSSTGTTVVPVRCVNISGNANGYDTEQLICIPMRDFGRTAYIFHQDVAEGFGATSFGCHIGFFYNNVNGANYSSFYAASFTIISVLPS
ncbi:hypothetical protein UFOVP298_24 [uncultured Caudovirales phage]|uniref:Uncharacterized protein n=1 Tax=uncultured Caudovirales phage TaxID=2100421 RepID=A0A6J5MWG7_9CAUD|nr:hypothetical protein UFOVP298_24 [uncultured Caudovirales phage]CAB4150682.1 hypothetical protein UFOVP572_15 [uncultured Caudovirales phage]